MEIFLGQLLISLFFAAVLAAVLWFFFGAPYKRGKDLEKMSREKGFEFDKEGRALGKLRFRDPPAPPPDPALNAEPPSGAGGLQIFSEGYSRTVSNLITVPFEKGKLFFFDYSYMVRFRNRRFTRRFTLALANLASPLPDFFLRPENFLDMLGEFLGYEDIDINGYPEFNFRYHLASPAPEAALSFFTKERITALESGPLWTIYGGGIFLVIFKKKGYTPVADYPAYIEEAKALINSLNLR